MEKNLGSGLSAKCVLVPGNTCKNKNKTINYINKLVEIPKEDSIMKKILLNEIVISKLIKDRSKKGEKWLDEHFGILKEVCPLDKITDSIKKKCELDSKKKDNYFIFVIKNVGCKPLKVKDIVLLKDGRIVSLKKISKTTIEIIDTETNETYCFMQGK